MIGVLHNHFFLRAVVLSACYLKYSNMNAFYSGSNLWLTLILCVKAARSYILRCFQCQYPHTALQTNEKWCSFDADPFFFFWSLLPPALNKWGGKINEINFSFTHLASIVSSSNHLVRDNLSAEEVEGHPRILSCLCNNQTKHWH